MTSLAFLFINSPREYLIATVLVTVFISAFFVLLCLIALRAYKETTGQSARMPARIPLPREPYIDLAAEREAFEIKREEREEHELLRRAS